MSITITLIYQVHISWFLGPGPWSVRARAPGSIVERSEDLHAIKSMLPRIAVKPNVHLSTFRIFSCGRLTFLTLSLPYLSLIGFSARANVRLLGSTYDCVHVGICQMQAPGAERAEHPQDFIDHLKALQRLGRYSLASSKVRAENYGGSSTTDRYYYDQSRGGGGRRGIRRWWPARVVLAGGWRVWALGCFTSWAGRRARSGVVSA